MSFSWRQACLFSPSLICLDACNLERDVRLLESAGVDLLHIDIIDGRFSPSLPLGLETVRRVRAISKLKFDVHLMATVNDGYFVDEILDIGAEQLIFHIETESHVDNLLNKIRSKNVRAGVALKPATPISALDCVIEKCDAVLLMLINPGYAWNRSEAQIPYADRKIRELRTLIDSRGLSTVVEIDGRVSAANIASYGRSIVDIFVAGSSCLDREAIADSVAKLNDLRSQILGGDAIRLEG